MRCALIGGGAILAGDKLGEGGEGVVYAVEDGARAVKLYHKPLSGAAQHKLRIMVARDVGPLAGQAAWPQALIAGPAGSVAGFVMPRASEPFDIHAVYSPRDRREKLPKADWKFLVRVAANLAAAFHAAHQAEVVIGDVNHGSVRVGANGCVRLIDCDSFQITHEGAVLRCQVGVDAYTPPELQGKRLSDIDRTVEHDLFGLAVLTFQLLFMGRHPFSGVPKSDWAPTDIPGAIAACAYAYGKGRSLLGPPPAAPPIAIVTPDIAALFEQAFAARGARPTAGAWFAALTAFSATLHPCGQNPRHAKPAHAPACPWCAFDHAGVEFFPAPLAAFSPVDLEKFDAAAFEAAWNRLELAQAKVEGLVSQAGSSHPNLDALPIDIKLKLDKARQSGATARMRCRIIGWVRRGFAIATLAVAGWTLVVDSFDVAAMVLLAGAGGLLFGGAFVSGPREGAEAAMKILHQRCRARRDDLATLAQRTETSLRAGDRREEGARLLGRIRTIQKLLASAPRDIQLRAFLDRFPLTKGCAAGVGDARLAQLASFGIESAADIDEDAILAIPGFGPQLAGALEQWRRDLEKRFRFNPAQPVAAAEVQRLQTELKKPLADYRREVGQIMQQAQTLERSFATIAHRSAAHDGALSAQVAAVVQAEADLKALRLVGR